MMIDLEPWLALSPKERGDLNCKIIVHQTAMYCIAVQAIYDSHRADYHHLTLIEDRPGEALFPSKAQIEAKLGISLDHGNTVRREWRTADLTEGRKLHRYVAWKPDKRWYSRFVAFRPSDIPAFVNEALVTGSRDPDCLRLRDAMWYWMPDGAGIRIMFRDKQLADWFTPNYQAARLIFP